MPPPNDKITEHNKQPLGSLSSISSSSIGIAATATAYCEVMIPAETSQQQSWR